jgi:hypothetical protein
VETECDSSSDFWIKIEEGVSTRFEFGMAAVEDRAKTISCAARLVAQSGRARPGAGWAAASFPRSGDAEG